MSQQPSLLADQRQSALTMFLALIQLYGPGQTSENGYKPAALALAFYDYSLCGDSFLMLFFSFICHLLCSQTAGTYTSDITVCLRYFDDLESWSQDKLDNAKNAIEDFAEHIIQHLLLPLRVSSLDMPQATHPAQPSSQSPTTESLIRQLYAVGASCLLRDNQQCVVSHGRTEAEPRTRSAQDSEDYMDIDETLLRTEPTDQFEPMEIAHILPRSPATITADNTELSNSQNAALQLLDILDPTMTRSIEDGQFNTLVNALTMTHHYRQLFNAFQIYFEFTGSPNEYKIQSTALTSSSLHDDPLFPVVRTLTFDSDYSSTIDLPSPQFLAVHRAIALIMELSNAGPYVEDNLRNGEEGRVQADRSTNLQAMIRLWLGGWRDGLAFLIDFLLRVFAF